MEPARTVVDAEGRREIPGWLMVATMVDFCVDNRAGRVAAAGGARDGACDGASRDGACDGDGRDGAASRACDGACDGASRDGARDGGGRDTAAGGRPASQMEDERRV